MLYKLSLKYQKEIALSCFSLFFISFLAPLKANNFGYNINYENYASLNNYDLGSHNYYRMKHNNNYMPGLSDPRRSTLNLVPLIHKAFLNSITHHISLAPVKSPAKLMIGGPSQPEMTSFQSVGTDNMVNLFTGDFSYNIPLLDVGGYPVNIFYNSGITMDQEASWVGLGWNINPGVINRSMRGIPDDFDGTDIITKTQAIKPDETWGINTGADFQIAGLPLTLGASTGISFNNRLGPEVDMGVSTALKLSKHAGDPKTSSLKVGIDLNLSSRGGATVTPSVKLDGEGKTGSVGAEASIDYNSRAGLEDMHVAVSASTEKGKSYGLEGQYKGLDEGKTKGGMAGGVSGSFSFAFPSFTPSITMPLTHESFSGNVTLGFEAYAVHPNFSIGGFYNKTYIASGDQVKQSPAYGMLYLQKGNNDAHALLDFNRLEDAVYTKNSTNIGMPAYTYDVFNISGEGTGGAFKAYRGDLGYVHDPLVATYDNSASLGIEIGVGDGVHVGGNVDYVYTPTAVSAWDDDNNAKASFAFKDSTAINQSVYFKNPGEKAIPDTNYQKAIGGEDLVRVSMKSGDFGQSTLLPALERINPNDNSAIDTLEVAQNLIKKRDKRTQVISCLTANEAAHVALDTMIYSYNPDTSKVIFGQCGGNSGMPYVNPDIHGINRLGGYRKANHISEINVLQKDGKKYVYGIPVYNTKQIDVTMAVPQAANQDTCQVPYTSTDDSPNNSNGLDNYYEKEEMPPYAVSYLLTSLVSPNYVDVTGDGITEDDLGDAVKFNYSKSDANYKWRTPANGASYSQGLRTENNDDKAHYIYGEREQWYLYSIESKNMVARFYVTGTRSDGRSVIDSTGGIGVTGNQQLSKISLFSKGDLLKAAKTGIAAKPIKTVYFVYSNRLCPDPTGKSTNNGTAVGPGKNGKLTLESIYFTYNGNEKQRKNKYTFHYPTDNNPNYNYTDNDRWGTYKPAYINDANPNDSSSSLNNNPGGLANADYPYTIQDKTKADKYAAAWTMDSITIPSGGKIGITYESDDYAYVQDKRAASMTQILGFGYRYDPQNSAQLYNRNIYDYSQDPAYGIGLIENQYIYIKLPVPISATTPVGMQNELQDRYFADVTQLYMKLAVNMPYNEDGSPGSFEPIPMYADIDSYGMVPGSNNEAYVKVTKMSSGHTPMVQYAFQFLSSNIPAEAFKGYNETKSGGFTAIFSAMAGSFATISELINGEDNTFLSNNDCKQIETNRSFVKLSNPAETKLGGGLRVKKVVINDNWNKMTGQYDATYGQEYSYTTTELINNISTTVSSGVASWEPSIGNDENPHRQIIRDLNKQKGGPFDYASVELPMGEMFYPSAAVGYSRVEVNSIHRDTVRNAPGTTVSEFYTTRDFPTKSSFTSLPNATQEFQPNPIMKILDFDLLERINLSQGFKVELNDMNGKEKSQATYSSLDTAPADYISKTTSYYNTAQLTDKTFGFNDKFNVIDGPDGIVDPNGVIGRDVEVMSDFRQHQSFTYTANVNTNLDFFFIGWFPVPLFNPLSPYYVDEATYRSAAITKIVNHYGVLDSTVVVDKGSKVKTENLLYDAETGDVLLTKTNNEHERPVYNFSYPAHWAYSGMGAAYKNIDVTIDNLTFRKGLLTTPIDTTIFESGDEIYVTSGTSHGPMKLEPCDEFTCGDPYLVKNTANKIWVVNTNKNAGSLPHFVFIDRAGQPYTAEQVKIHIIRSGHRNMLDQTVGSITSMNNPIDSATGKLIFNDTTAILHTTAATFKDDWRVDDLLYRVDSLETKVSTVNRVFFQDTAHQIMTITKNDLPNYNGDIHASDTAFTNAFFNNPFFDFFNFSNDSVGSYIYTPNSYATHSSLRLGQTPGGSYLTRKTWIRFDKLDSFLNLNLDISCIAHSPVTFYATAHDNNIYTCHGNNAYHPEDGLGVDTIVHQSSGLNGGWISYRDNPFNAGNTSIVQLMRGGWYDYNDFTDWKQAFTDMDDHSNSVFALSPIPPVGRQAATGDSIGVKNLLQQLMTDRNSGEAIAPALSFQMLQRSPVLGQQNIKCWINQETNCLYKKPAIEFSYFPCIAGKLDSVVNDTTGYCSALVSSPTYCRSRLADKVMNPYVVGVLGDWRVDSTYAYYGSRKETDPTVPIDTRIAGAIVGYKDFWNFNTPFLQRNYGAANVWVWNSTITQYNRKGYEIENKDPLGRYNAGLYGYNQQLPIAVTNNGTERETMFDGFEDYDYQTSNCASCQPKRHVNFGDISGNIVAEQQHTGQYSLKVNPGQSIGFAATVVNKSSLDSSYGLRVKIDSNYVIDTIVVSKGIGLMGSYYPGAHRDDWANQIDNCNTTIYSNHPDDITDSSLLVPPHNYFGKDTTPVMLDAVAPYHVTKTDQVPVTGKISSDRFAAEFDGYVQPLASGNYFFKGRADDGFKATITVNGTDIILADELVCNTWNAFSDPVSVNLLKGQFYKLVIQYGNYQGDHMLDFEWKPSECTPFTPIPQYQLYSTSQITNPSNPTFPQSVTYDTTLCTQLDTVQVRGRALTDTFSLLQGKRMLISAWAKEGTTDCKCSAYKNNTISATFTGATDSYILKPSGNIIEGWQRYEGVINIPDSATKIVVELNNLSGTAPVYFDDIRMHPYNANMKSFVYNSSNLRLMAELDENNYASFYEYDDDGTLTRVKKETIRGIQTITETRSALQKVQ
jgi:hypothetical protein